MLDKSKSQLSRSTHAASELNSELNATRAPFKSFTNTLSVSKLAGLVSALFAFAASAPASAACDMMGCACKPSELQFASPSMQPNEDGEYAISLEADNVTAQGQDLVSLSGNAEVSQGRQTIVADELKYYRESERVVATGNVEMISEGGDYLSSESIDVHAPTHIGEMRNTQFKLARGISSADGVDTVQIESRGSAGLVSLEGEGFLRLEDARYTNCPEGNESVIISAQQLELDRNGGIGKARNATIRFKGLPIFYTPYISFPINDERKTGFLTPGFGSDQDSGNIVEIPWYWNIAKNQDATITPRYFSDRGAQIGLEYRLRTLNSNTYVYGEMLPSDDLYDEQDRDLLTIQHSQQFTDNLSATINYNDVSDVDYFDDLRNEVRYFSATYVPRDAQVNYSHDYFRVNVRANEYQIIDPDIPESRKPYERLPSLTFSTNLPDGPLGMKYGVTGSYTNFSSVSRVEGKRTALNPYLNIPFENLWGYIRPAVSVHYRGYSLNNRAEGVDTDPSVTVPVFSLDTGVYFEKNTKWFGDSALQTLEPRVFYAYAPDEDQDDIPLFDASEVSLNNFSNIFRANRFYGSDRVADTNQITLGLTTRIIDNETGDQRLKASFGQLYLIDDLQQRVSGSTPIESGLGDFLAEMRTESKGPWTTYSFIQYNHDDSEIRTARFQLGYEPRNDNRKRLQLGYYRSEVRERVTDQLTVNPNWPISDRWQFFANERYSLEDSESLFTSAGVEYDSCCWKLRISGQDRISNRDIDDKKTAFFVELELTSLGSIRTGL